MGYRHLLEFLLPGLWPVCLGIAAVPHGDLILRLSRLLPARDPQASQFHMLTSTCFLLALSKVTIAILVGVKG